MARLSSSLWITATLAACATPLAAASVTSLVETRVEREIGRELPDNAQISAKVAGAAPETADYILDFWVDGQTGRYLALLALEDGRTQRIQGIVRISVPVAVPTRRMMPGEVVADADLDVVTLPHVELGTFVVTDVGDIVGKEVRRVLRKGRPVMEQSIAAPFAVERGDRVTIILSNGPLRLTAPGRSLSDAHIDDDVRVVNLSSSKTVTAFVTGEGRVEVMK